MGSQPTLRRILISAVAALSIGLGAASLIAGFSDSFPLRLLQGVAVFAAGAVVLGGGAVLALIHLAGWRDPESEEDFEALVQRAERLAAQGSGAEDPVSEDQEFRALVRSAMNELPLEFHRALEHVADRRLRRRASASTPTGSIRAIRSPVTTSTTGS